MYKHLQPVQETYAHAKCESVTNRHGITDKVLKAQHKVRLKEQVGLTRKYRYHK